MWEKLERGKRSGKMMCLYLKNINSAFSREPRSDERTFALMQGSSWLRTSLWGKLIQYLLNFYKALGCWISESTVSIDIYIHSSVIFPSVPPFYLAAGLSELPMLLSVSSVRCVWPYGLCQLVLTG